MFNQYIINKLVNFIYNHNGIADKIKLSELVKSEFNLIKNRSVFYCDNFAIRFCKSATSNMSNTVLSLSALKGYDSNPFIVCIVTKNKNFLLLANSTFLSKISHSSQQLRIDNIRGSFNGSDIMREVESIQNAPENFMELFLFHENFSFHENFVRLVEKTTGIVPTGVKFVPNDTESKNIFAAPIRANSFIQSAAYNDLKEDLNRRVESVQTEIAIAAFIDNVNIRGRIIEYLITCQVNSLRTQLINALHNNDPLPVFTTKDSLGDYSKTYADFNTETEIKTKVLFLNSNPKAYNLDKFLRFLSEDKSVYMIYLIGIDVSKKINVALVSVFDTVLLKGTVVQSHWAGRNSRGVTQFYGKSLTEILQCHQNKIDIEESHSFLQKITLL